MTFGEYASIAQVEYIRHAEKPVRASLLTLSTGEVVMRIDKYKKTATGNSEEFSLKRGVVKSDVMKSFFAISLEEFCEMGVVDCSNT